jgi:hypothetical protein
LVHGTSGTNVSTALKVKAIPGLFYIFSWLLGKGRWRNLSHQEATDGRCRNVSKITVSVSAVHAGLDWLPIVRIVWNILQYAGFVAVAIICHGDRCSKRNIPQVSFG